MFLSELESARPEGTPGETDPGKAPPISGVRRLLAYRPERTVHLNRYTQAVMRGPSDLSPGQRELIAAFTSARNNCPF
jgi:alkylhydroperoxidase family enzyme